MNQNNSAQPGLTDDEIKAIRDRLGGGFLGPVPFARAVEAAVLSKLRAPVADERAACPTDVCQAGKADGVLCANDECDRANGVRPASAPVADERAAYTDPLSDFQEGQWWVKELDELARAPGATHDQKRAVAVVHHMLRSAALASAPVAGERCKRCGGPGWYTSHTTGYPHSMPCIDCNPQGVSAERLEKDPFLAAQLWRKPVGFADAYEGAREDLAIWKRRALEAERDLRAERETSSRLVAALNAENGPMHKGEPAAQASEAVRDAALEETHNLALAQAIHAVSGMWVEDVTLPEVITAIHAINLHSAKATVDLTLPPLPPADLMADPGGDAWPFPKVAYFNAASMTAYARAALSAQPGAQRTGGSDV